MGAGAFLAGRKKPIPELSRYLLVRGLWLIALEIVVVRCLGLQFNIDYRVTMLTVLWALGWSMIALAGLVHLPTMAVGIIGVAAIVAHNLFDGVRASSFGLIAVVVCYLRYGDAHWMFESPRLDQFPFVRPPGWEFPLPAVYLIWAGVVVAMYPLCARVTAMRPRR